MTPDGNLDIPYKEMKSGEIVTVKVNIKYF